MASTKPKKSPAKTALRKSRSAVKAVRPVAIVAMGNSHTSYMHMHLLDANRHLIEGHDVWGINTIGTVIRCDRVIHIDPLADYPDGFTIPKGSMSGYHSTPEDVVIPPDPGMARRYMEMDTPIYTGMVDPRFPSSVRYPIEEVMDLLKFPYFNSCVAYAIALAILEKRPEIWMFGCDYAYPNQNAGEAGRACTEFWLGWAASKGIKVVAAGNCVLLDNWSDKRVLYGYGGKTWDEIQAESK